MNALPALKIDTPGPFKFHNKSGVAVDITEQHVTANPRFTDPDDGSREIAGNAGSGFFYRTRQSRIVCRGQGQWQLGYAG